MGAASSGGSDNDVSGNEAFYSPPSAKVSTYSSRKIKTVNQQITDQGRKNRESRKSPIEKFFNKTLIGSTLNKISNSKFSLDRNYKSRVAFAKKSGKFKDTPLTREFVLSSGFKNQLDGMGYSDRIPKGRAGSENDPISKPVIVKTNVGGKPVQTTESKIAEDKKEATKYDSRKTKKKGMTKNLLTSARGVIKTSPDYSLGKKSLLGQVV